MSTTMPIRSGELLELLDLSSAYLTRWRRAGFITPDLIEANRSRGAVWPDWTVRMCMLLRLELTSPGGNHTTHLEMLRRVADVLAQHPDVPFVVIEEQGRARPAWSAAHAVAIHRRSTSLWTTIVAVPTPGEIPAP